MTLLLERGVLDFAVVAVAVAVVADADADADADEVAFKDGFFASNVNPSTFRSKGVPTKAPRIFIRMS